MCVLKVDNCVAKFGHNIILWFTLLQLSCIDSITQFPVLNFDLGWKGAINCFKRKLDPDMINPWLHGEHFVLFVAVNRVSESLGYRGNVHVRLYLQFAKKLRIFVRMLARNDWVIQISSNIWLFHYFTLDSSLYHFMFFMIFSDLFRDQSIYLLQSISFSKFENKYKPNYEVEKYKC